MARGITEDDVWKACDALLLEGARPTIERVRQKIGRGSPNTVSPMLETWFRHLGARIADPGSFSAPASIVDPVQQVAQHLWEVAQAEARRDLADQLRAGLADATANVEAEKDRAARSDAVALAASSEALLLRKELKELQHLLNTERTAHAIAAAHLQEAKKRHMELQAHLEQAQKSTEAERERCSHSIAATEERAAAAERRAGREIERERTLRAKLEKSNETMVKRLEIAMAAQGNAKEQLGFAQLKFEQFQTQSEQGKQDLILAVQQRNIRIQELEGELSNTTLKLSKSSAQEALVTQLMAKLSAKKMATGSQSGAPNITSAKRKRST